MNLCVLLYPFCQQPLDEIGQIVRGVCIFQQSRRCSLGVLSQQHSCGLIVGVTALAGWPASAPYRFDFSGRWWRCSGFSLCWRLLEFGENTAEFTLLLRHI